MIVPRITPNGQEKPRIWFDVLVVGGLVALVFGGAQVARQLGHVNPAAVEIDLSVRSLPKYALFSFARGWIAYFCSLSFTLVVGSWAFYDLRARRFLIPALDILQSLPVLTFLPAFQLLLVGLFPGRSTGIELVCILAIFTGQVWNMVFSYYDSLRGIPGDFRLLGKLYGFSWWHRFWRVELEFGAQGLLYNSMVSMAGGWFFLSTCETQTIGDQSFRLPGIGSYMAAAIGAGDVKAQIFGIIAMGVVIVVTDRLVWWPLVVWSRKFKLDDFGTGTTDKSAIQLWLARSKTTQILMAAFSKVRHFVLRPAPPATEATSLRELGVPPPRESWTGRVFYYGFLVVMIGLVGLGGFRLVQLLAQVHGSDWITISKVTGLTFGRVLASVAIGTLWTVPFGIWIGLNPKLSSRLQPVIQFAASFPAPMLYPWFIILIYALGGTLQWGAILLILFGTQWYILFNVAGAAAAIPNDIISCASILRLGGWTKWSKFLIPAIMPGLITGWITAAGGAWNASIVSEFVQVGTKTYEATGLGNYITNSANSNNYPCLTAAGLVMSVLVVTINRTVWKRLQNIANDRCRFGV